MGKNKRAPSVLQKYLVWIFEKKGAAEKDVFRYFQTQKAAKEWARGRAGKKRLFRINYDFYEELK